MQWVDICDRVWVLLVLLNLVLWRWVLRWMLSWLLLLLVWSTSSNTARVTQWAIGRSISYVCTLSVWICVYVMLLFVYTSFKFLLALDKTWIWVWKYGNLISTTNTCVHTCAHTLILYVHMHSYSYTCTRTLCSYHTRDIPWQETLEYNNNFKIISKMLHIPQTINRHYHITFQK